VLALHQLEELLVELQAPLLVLARLAQDRADVVLLRLEQRT
jgi:hypothetical protein